MKKDNDIKKQEKKEEKEKKNKYKEKCKELDDKYKRALADYQNLLKRTANEKQDFYKYAQEQFILEMLPIYDNLKIAVEHVSEDNKDPWLEGVRYVVKQFDEVLSNMGVEQIKTVGEKFDPHTMEALEGKGDKVVKEAKPGYKLKDKVIVAARVVLE